MDKYKRVYAQINLDCICYNMQQMKNNISGNTKMIAVIKADGYGHGALPIARLVQDYDYVWGFAVATADEALILRRHNIKKPILVLGYVFSEHFDEIIKNDIRCAVFSLETARELSKAAVKADKNYSIHLKLDTGMGRIGFLPTDENIQIIKKIYKLPNISIEAVFTHFAKADETDKTSANMQLNKYVEFVQRLEQEGIEIPLKHCSNSAGIIDLKAANMDIVRAGISIYGLYPSKEVNRQNVKLKPALELKSHIVNIKEVPANTGISYGWTYITKEPRRVATIPVGYADGYPRSLSNKGYVLVNGKRAPIIGRICMDQFMIDITGIDDVKPYNMVTLVGQDNESRILVDELSELSGRFNYEFVCDLSKRIPRIYVKNNKIIETKDYFDE